MTPGEFVPRNTIYQYSQQHTKFPGVLFLLHSCLPGLCLIGMMCIEPHFKVQYDGPYEVLEAEDKVFCIRLGDREELKKFC